MLSVVKPIHCSTTVNYYSAIVANVSNALRTLVPRKQPSFQALFEGAKSCCVRRSSGKEFQIIGHAQQMLGGQQWRAGVVAQPSVAVWLTGDAAYRQMSDICHKARYRTTITQNLLSLL